MNREKNRADCHKKILLKEHLKYDDIRAGIIEAELGLSHMVSSSKWVCKSCKKQINVLEEVLMFRRSGNEMILNKNAVVRTKW